MYEDSRVDFHFGAFPIQAHLRRCSFHLLDWKFPSCKPLKIDNLGSMGRPSTKIRIISAPIKNPDILSDFHNPCGILFTTRSPIRCIFFIFNKILILTFIYLFMRCIVSIIAVPHHSFLHIKSISMFKKQRQFLSHFPDYCLQIFDKRISRATLQKS